MDDDGKPPTASRLYLELTARLIEREMVKFTSGEQAALLSFAHVTKLARNAREELAASGVRKRVPCRPASTQL